MVVSQVKVPVIVVGCKLDQRDDRQPSLEQVMAPLMHEFREIETCIECSAIKQIQVQYFFQYYHFQFWRLERCRLAVLLGALLQCRNCLYRLLSRTKTFLDLKI